MEPARGERSKDRLLFAASTGDVWSIAVVGKDQLGVTSSYNGAPTQTITVQGYRRGSRERSGHDGQPSDGNPVALLDGSRGYAGGRNV